MAKHPEKEAEFKSALRRQILGGSELLKRELRRGTRFVYSEQYPTQVLNTKLGRFIRINAENINEDNIDNLLKCMMGIDKYITVPEQTTVDATGTEVVIPEQTMELTDVLYDAVERVKATDYVNLHQHRGATASHTKDADDEDDDDYYYDDDEESDDIFKYDSSGNIIGLVPGITIEPQVVVPKTPLEDPEEFDPASIEIEDDTSIKDDTSSTDMTDGAEALMGNMGGEDGKSPTKDKTVLTTELVEQALNDVEQHKGISKFHSSKSILTKKDLLALQPKIKQLLKAFQGTGSQEKVIVPTKRMSPKDVANDREKCYIRKTGSKGKHIKLNFLIDMSGSMGGEPVKNAVRLVYLFNQLAKQGYVTMSVLYSTTHTNFKLQLPATDAEILSLCAVQSAEGLAKTIHAHADTIRGTNTICLTDGDIVDEPIDKMFWSKHKSVSTGIYVNPSLSSYTEWTGKLNKWFNHSVVRKSLDELIEWLIRVGLKG